MLLVGLTGNIASGKSTVSRMLAERGATIVDADVLAREAVEPGSRGLASIVERWGHGVLQPDGALDRAALRALVFADPDQLDSLNHIVHPEVDRRRRAAIETARARGDHIVVCDIPLLFEKKLADEFDMIVLVDAPRPLRQERVVHERGIDQAEAMAMIAAQMPSDLKRARADLVIHNAGSLADLERQVAAVWTSLGAAATSRKTASVP